MVRRRPDAACKRELVNFDFIILHLTLTIKKKKWKNARLKQVAHDRTPFTISI